MASVDRSNSSAFLAAGEPTTHTLFVPSGLGRGPSSIDDGAARGRAVLARFRPRIEEALGHVASHLDDDGALCPAGLKAAMDYSLLAGGKRLRPALVLACAQAARALLGSEGLAGAAEVNHGDDDVSEPWRLCQAAAIAIECVHTYSLIHDDLPAMDNDVLRRGRPTLHVATDDATAILAGDGLLTDAFAILATAPIHAAAQIRELALAAGSTGMVGGQYDDIRNARTAPPASGFVDDEGMGGLPNIESVHRRKTGRLFEAACVMGALSVGVPSTALGRWRTYGAQLGLAFQSADDVLDVVGNANVSGKSMGRDHERGQATYPARYGLEEAQRRALLAVEEASAALSGVPGADALVGLAWLAIHRDA